MNGYKSEKLGYEMFKLQYHSLEIEILSFFARYRSIIVYIL